MSQYKMLGEIICYCSHCGFDLNHMITLMEGSRPAKVMCLTCKSEHRFRDPEGKKDKKKEVKGTPSQKTRARVSVEEQDWKLKLSDTSITPKPYKMDGGYAMDEHVYHVKFGKGLVIGFDFPDKVHLFFEDGVKVLKGKKG